MDVRPGPPPGRRPVYGGNPELRAAPEGRGVGHVLAVACSHEVTADAGKFRADALAVKVPKRARQKLSAGAGAKALALLAHAFLAVVRADEPARHPAPELRTALSMTAPTP